jgi:hypothetical protein
MSCDNQDQINAALVAAAQGPLQASSSAGSVTARSTADLIAAANYAAAQCAATLPSRGIRFTALIPGGTSYWPYSNPWPRYGRW